MGASFTIDIGRMIRSAEILEGGEDVYEERDGSEMKKAEAAEAKARYDSACQILQAAADKLSDICDKSISEQRTGIAKLATEIAARILRKKVVEGDYQITAIIEEALKEAPAHGEITVRLNPDDCETVMKAQQAGETGKLSGIAFAPDAAVGRAECRIETGRGSIALMIEEQLERVSRALERAG